MISGSIKLYPEEPERTYQYNPNYAPFKRNHSDISPITKEIREIILTQTLKEVAKIGFTVGSKVKRSTNIGPEGVVTNIYSDISKAYNWQSGEIEPLQVCWEQSNGHTFDYTVEELKLIEGETVHENLPAVYETC